MDDRSPLGDIMNTCKNRNKRASRDESNPYNGNKYRIFFLLYRYYTLYTLYHQLNVILLKEIMI
jgi:hypothetical protein